MFARGLGVIQEEQFVFPLDLRGLIGGVVKIG